MLTSQSQREPDSGHGRLRMELAELRRQLAASSFINDAARQRLLELTQRLARVRALGGEYTRLGLSEAAASAMLSEPVAV